MRLRHKTRVLEKLMPKLRFMKMNGAGNDFVMLDNRARRFAAHA